MTREGKVLRLRYSGREDLTTKSDVKKTYTPAPLTQTLSHTADDGQERELSIMDAVRRTVRVRTFTI